MIVRVNMAKEVADYFNGYNLDEIINLLLNEYDFLHLPSYSGRRDVIRDINVTNELYINMYQHYGPHSKKVSLSRLLEHGYNMDCLATLSIEKEEVNIDNSKNKAKSLIKSAYEKLLQASVLLNNDGLKELAKEIGSLGRSL